MTWLDNYITQRKSKTNVPENFGIEEDDSDLRGCWEESSEDYASVWRKSSNIVIFCTIWYHSYNLKNVKATHGGVLLLVKLQAFSLQLYWN